MVLKTIPLKPPLYKTFDRITTPQLEALTIMFIIIPDSLLGLYPVGRFNLNGSGLPSLYLNQDMIWPYPQQQPPPAVPSCGFHVSNGSISTRGGPNAETKPPNKLKTREPKF